MRAREVWITIVFAFLVAMGTLAVAAASVWCFLRYIKSEW